MFTQAEQQIVGYVEVASPQLLDDKWQDFVFDLASGQNVLEDTVTPESASGYVYRSANHTGSATHNRFLYWRTTSDIIELIEVSTEMVLEDNQVRIRFSNSNIINDVTVIEFSDCIVIMIATISSVHRLYLPHPRTTNKSVLADLTSEVLFNPASYFIIGQHGSAGSQHPISATSWFDHSMIKCALSFPDSSILIVQFGHQTHHITTTDIKQSGIIGRLWSKMPNLWAKSANECDNAIFAFTPLSIDNGNDTLLFTLCRDCRIRVFSTNTRECVCSYNMIPQASFHQSFGGHVNPTCEVPMLKIFKSQVFVYQSDEFIILDFSHEDGVYELKETIKVPAPQLEQLIDFAITHDKIWALGSTETESFLYYMDHGEFADDTPCDVTMVVENSWTAVNIFEDIPRSLVAEIFWSNKFSTETVRKALIGLAGPQIPQVNSMAELEEFASTRIFDGDQDKQWHKFHEYCRQNHQTANKNIGLVAAQDGSVISVIKRSNPAFITPWHMRPDDRGPYRALEMPADLNKLSRDLNRISECISESLSCMFDQKLLDEPTQIMTFIEEMVENLDWKPWFEVSDIDILPAVDYLCDKLDLTEQATEFNERILREVDTKMRSEHNPLGSNFGITLTYELFRQFVRARMTLARDLLLYTSMLQRYLDSEKTEGAQIEIYDELHTSGRLKRILDSLRSYGVLVWMAETPIKSYSQQISKDVIDLLARHFEFFRSSRDMQSRASSSTTERILQQNLLTSFLTGGGVNFSTPINVLSTSTSTLSSSDYANEIVLNLCKLLWPNSKHLCLPEFMFTQQLDEHLAKYLDLTEDWLYDGEQDRHFIRAANCMLQNRATHGVEIFNRLWMGIDPGTIMGRFVGLDPDISSSDNNLTFDPDLIYRYYEKLIELFQVLNNRQCLVMLINHCMSLIDEKSDCDQLNRINCLRAKLFQFYLELEDSDEAYHIMVLTTDPSLRFNCLRKFIVSHCEKEQWMNLLSYPFIDIKNDFIDILSQKAQSLDLSKLDESRFYKTSYYDLLFASYISDDDYKSGAEIMYNYAQRLAQEAPGLTSIRKQADCLLVSLNSLRCVEDKEKYLEFRSISQKEKSRTSILKRSHDGQLDASANLQCGDNSQVNCTRVECKEIERRYELTRARLRLLEKDQTGNAIALSPMTPEETVAQLVAASMFSAAMDLALLFGTSMAPILEGLTAKYVLIMRLSTIDVGVHQEIERGLSDLFASSYSIIDTYNYIANSTSSLADRLWQLIHHYLITYDGVSHTYSTTEFANSFSNTTLLMRVVACKLLSAGYDVPASLRRLYLTRNPAELLKLLMKYDRLTEAAELATEMIDRTLEPANCLTFSTPYGSARPAPIYLPSHLILSLINYLNEDATNTLHIKIANGIADKLSKFRDFVKAN